MTSLKIMDNNEVVEEEFHEYFDFGHGDEDCAIYDDMIELATYLAEVEFSDSDQCNANLSTCSPCDLWQLTTPKGYREIFLESVKLCFTFKYCTKLLFRTVYTTS